MSHLLRISLPDVPGSLGAVAAAIGVAGGNILAIEVVEQQEGQAVDDVFVEFLPGVMPDMVVSAVHRLDRVKVVWVSRYPAAGTLQLDLEAVEEITDDPDSAFETLARVVPRAFRADWAMVVVRRGESLRSLAASQGAPTLPPSAHSVWFPLMRTQRLLAGAGWDGWGSTVVAAAPIGADDTAVIFGRHGGPDVLSSELARLGHLAALTASIRSRQAAGD